MKISAIYFDLGKTLLDFDFSVSIQKIAQRSSLSQEEIEQISLTETSAFDQYDLGQISSEQFFSKMAETFQFSGSTEELRHLWCDIFTPLEEHITLARRLAEYYPLGLISNTCEAHIQFAEATFDFFPIFREKIYSYQVGAMKPNPDIYHLATQRLQVDKLETILVDDREDNILAASKLGWQTIHLRPEVSLRLALQSYDLTGI